jgi:hypothetical protein
MIWKEAVVVCAWRDSEKPWKLSIRRAHRRVEIRTVLSSYESGVLPTRMCGCVCVRALQKYFPPSLWPTWHISSQKTEQNKILANVHTVVTLSPYYLPTLRTIIYIWTAIIRKRTPLTQKSKKFSALQSAEMAMWWEPKPFTVLLQNVYVLCTNKILKSVPWFS